MTRHSDFPELVEAFFTERLLRQRKVSPETVAGYRDAFRLLLRFATRRLKKEPSKLALKELDARFIGEFLDHLEDERLNSARTRNARLAAIHSFFRYVSFEEPRCADQCRRILAIPSKRYDRKPIAYLTREEIDALVAAPDTTTWIGRRDQVLLLVAIQTGLRVSELIGLQRQDVRLGRGAHVQCKGKGRKQRCTPLRKEAVRLLVVWLRECPNDPESPIFPSSRGGALSRDAVERLVARHCQTAVRKCSSLKRKTVTPHVLRHTAAMELLQHGIDRSVIALWLGHESVETTQMYLHADLRLKEQAMSRTVPLGVKTRRYRPADKLLAFLESL
ncbi:MAG: tyrosine-type recombinase/integrase [Candidatus Anammoximicrobium sp.]|nr:tyrosine-type recombinase/integrase [Candidatus Anammoximicrobium sp.]